MKRPLALTLAALVAALAAAPRAHAQSAADVDAARELFREGSRFAEDSRWAEAVDRYTRSLKLKRAAITLYSLGVAQRKTGRLVEALENFRAFLVEPSAPATQPYEQPARDAVADLERRVARAAITVVPPDAPGLGVTVDGDTVPVEALSIPRLVNPGAHTLVATAPGFQPARASVTLAEGSVQQVQLVLAPAPADAVPPGPAPAPAPPLAAVGAPSRVLPITLMVVGGVAVVAGVSVGMVGVKEAGDPATRSGTAAAQAAKTKALAGDVVTGVGVAAAATGLIVLLVQRPRAGRPQAGRVTPWADGSTAGLRLRF